MRRPFCISKVICCFSFFGSWDRWEQIENVAHNPLPYLHRPLYTHYNNDRMIFMERRYFWTFKKHSGRRSGSYYNSTDGIKISIDENIQKIAEGLEVPLSKLFDDLEGEYADGSKGLSNLSSSGDNT